MIDRYTLPEMGAIWTTEARFQRILDVEIAACEAFCRRGEISEEDLATIKARARFDIHRINELERTLKHDVIAFLTSVGEHVGEPARHIHRGLTSSDVLDTALGAQLRDAGLLLQEGLERLLTAVARRAREHRHTVQIGRTHGIHAEPITFGLKLLGWYEALRRCQERLERGIEAVAVGKLSGAVGTYASVHPDVEAWVCHRMGLMPDRAATQVVARDRHAEFFCTLAVIGATIERCAVEIRHLQRTEVLEVEEPFTPGQKGSSAMPHKRNPVLSENLTGGARLLRSYASAALEDVALWHERDISHSSVERVIAPDATILLHFMLHRLAGLVDGLVVYPERMAENLGRTRGLLFSQRALLALVQAGMSRDDAYSRVQACAMRVWAGEGDLRQLLSADGEVCARLDEATLSQIFDHRAFLVEIDGIFTRVLGDT